MENTTDRRLEQRLRYHWPIWFAEDFNDTLTQGQMVDASSGGAAFTCYSDENCPYPGQAITTRFSIPRFGDEDCFDMESFTRTGHVCRVEEINPFMKRAAIQFAEPLPFRPGEQTETKSQTVEKLKAVTI
ncbi:MAG: PilZ domain-containing protein [Planctomycetes bacterium]|nr:PilZ domain-containing protein [Planctomycetota bacterium]